ncbi:RNA-dependent RNA polymerase mitoviral protein [Dioscorea alata]|uniref:RNA-dependent RNA polymerase mitoviral protein n=1 Tax=Dioscorea alata TaxID=55571 RepID=A0ACB7UCB1_DIOAL|nr:RNA-dependent RNA polymerase mitoviral protein [Dioscorea alata]
MQFIHAHGEQWSQGALWYPYIRYAFDPNGRYWSERSLEWVERRIDVYLPAPQALEVPLIVGRLACSVEGASKRRIFAIGNYVNQRLLRPVHDWLMRLLREIPIDGTFNQTTGFTSWQQGLLFF